MTMKPARLLDQYFYFFMMLLIATIVVFGFSQTVERNLIHAAPPRPALLYAHALIFSGWVAFLIVQSLLVRVRKVRWHRRAGWFGFALGCAVVVVGLWTAAVMSRFRIIHFHGKGAVPNLELSFYDIGAFAVPFALAILSRRKPEYHRRLILLATSALTSAAWARFPPGWIPRGWFFAGVDLLVLLGVAHDLIVDRRIHRVYMVGLPAFVVCQCATMYIILSKFPLGVRIANAILR
jgi:hypothetical protein